jgi:F0F1-type ATP synthase assembly protein I
MAENESPDASQDSQVQPSVEQRITRRGRMFSARDLRATTIGWEIAIPIVGGPSLGFFLDRQYGSSPRLTLILLGVGILTAIAAVIRYVKYEFYVMNKEENEKRQLSLKE